MVPLLSIPPAKWAGVKKVANDSAMVNVYHIEEEHGLSIMYQDYNDVADGKYDLPLRLQDFFPN